MRVCVRQEIFIYPRLVLSVGICQNMPTVYRDSSTIQRHFPKFTSPYTFVVY